MPVEPREEQYISIYAGERLIADRVAYCDTRQSRGRGLIGRKTLAEGEGLLMVLPPYQQGRRHLWVSIHMLFVPFPLAAAWLDERGKVAYARLALPWRPYYSSPHPAWYTLELHPRWLDCLRPGVQVYCDRPGERGSALFSALPREPSGRM